MAGPVINIPMALALSIALSMVPAIAAANSVRDTAFLDTNIRLGLRTAMIIGVPCTFGLLSLAEPIMLLLFPLQAESASSAAPCLFILAVGITFLSVAQTMAGILQGLGKPYIAVVSLGIGVVVKGISTYLLSGVTEWNVQGAAAGSTIGYAVIGLLNFIAVKNLTGTRFNLNLAVMKPLISGIVMCIVVLASYYVMVNAIGNSLSTALSICVGVAVYGIYAVENEGYREE